jgi:hypothetical protein
MENQATDNEFKISTLRRRLHHLNQKLEGQDSTKSRRFNMMEAEALQAGIGALENASQLIEIKTTLINLLTALETGTDDELVAAVSHSHKVIDKYRF